MYDLPGELRGLYDQGSLREIDLAFADLVGRMHGSADLNVLLGAALASRVLGDGHVCLDLNEFAEGKFPGEVQDDAETQSSDTTPLRVRLPALKNWRAALEAASSVVAAPEGEKTARRPLVLDARGRLYLFRHWAEEYRVARDLLERARKSFKPSAELARQIGQLLQTADGDGGEQQRRACELGLTRALAIISGGPGTGKTYTVARLAALLLREHPEFRIRLAAPTGKAAHRMVESIRAAKASLPAEAAGNDVRRKIPEKAETLHRLLGASADGRVFRRNRQNPIEADVLIVDEASMIALPMMARLLDALEPETRLVLVGDMDQLASVEPGSVLGDLCRAALDKASGAGIGACLVALRQSHRFPPGHPVACISKAIKEAHDAAGAQHAWEEVLKAKSAGVALCDATAPLADAQRGAAPELQKLIWNGYLPLVNAETPEEAFAAFAHFRILCCHRSGPFGVGALNSLVESILSSNCPEIQVKRLLKPKGGHYERQALMITQNNYEHNLFNGDIGVVLKNKEGQLTAYFESLDENGERATRAVPVNLLPPCETAFATTVHKAQGSEFANLLIVLPPKHTPLLSKELLYTALTRIKPDPKRPADTGKIHLWCTENGFKSAALQATRRASGLREALEGC